MDDVGQGRTAAPGVTGRGARLTSDAAGPSLRRFPYPYRAMLAVTSDLDETPDRHVYGDTMQYLNTTSVTAMGPGVGLEVGNSIYFDMPPEQFAYWNTDDHGRALVRDLIRSGHVDCLHSFGDLATTRVHAARALEELARHECRLEVWIDHGVAPTNLGSDIMRGTGDVPGTAAYHADLSFAMGLQFVWRGRVTSVIGQDVRRALGGIYRGRHAPASVRTLLKEATKGLLAGWGRVKYAMHARNDLLRRVVLRSGHRAWEFLRANPHWGGVSCGDTVEGLADVLVEPVLSRLVEREGVCLLYTHLGKVGRRDQPVGPRTRAALRRLSRFHQEGQILVTTTRRVLGYRRAHRLVAVTGRTRCGLLEVHVATAGRDGERLPERDLAGLTIYVPDANRVCLSVDGRRWDDLRRNPPDHTGRPSVSVPWARLEWPRP